MPQALSAPTDGPTIVVVPCFNEARRLNLAAFDAFFTRCPNLTLLLVDAGLAPWIAALIAAAVMGLFGYLLAQSGISALKKKSIAPVETMDSLKETTQWLKNETR